MEVLDIKMNKASLMSLKLSTKYEIWVIGRTKKDQDGTASNPITITTGKFSVLWKFLRVLVVAFKKMISVT